jgi:hypothetical protein
MPICRFCKTSAGLLRSVHPECELKHKVGMSRLRGELTEAMLQGQDLSTLKARILTGSDPNNISADEKREAAITVWEGTVDRFLDDGAIDSAEERKLLAYQEQLDLSRNELDGRGAYTKFVKGRALDDILRDVIPKRMTVPHALPINLQRGETIVWVFSGSQYLEDQNKRTYVGGSQGVSVRIAKGLYYRVSAFKGEAVNTTVRTAVDRGTLAITDKNIYFAGPAKSLRVPYNKIVSFQPFTDGFGIIRDGANTKPQLFVTGDGWFTYNLVTNLARLASEA